jgi:hypothetical protein
MTCDKTQISQCDLHSQNNINNIYLFINGLLNVSYWEYVVSDGSISE